MRDLGSERASGYVVLWRQLKKEEKKKKKEEKRKGKTRMQRRELGRHVTSCMHMYHTDCGHPSRVHLELPSNR
jgi:hypothetical protein